MTTDAMVPSYRVQREASALPWRMLAVAGVLLALVAGGAGGWWAFQRFGGPQTIPVVEADPRPYKVRPDDPGGLRVPNQAELILERPAARSQGPAQAGRASALAPEAETPDLNMLRAAVAPPPVSVAAAPPQPAPEPAAAPEVAAAAPPAPEPAPQPAAAPAPARAATGSVQVQLGALTSVEAARAEWARLNRLVPELLEGRTPQIVRFEREGRSPLFRLRTGGLPDADTAAEFCEQIKARRGACMMVRS
ncbi:SPOR domain-containing protein [Falsiroseomonas sp.]|uniref:SPOR domain-containing protein n=1 Tax=Falsiroseomonas sp. TaxID=2870721 RepID=UPI0035660795